LQFLRQEGEVLFKNPLKGATPETEALRKQSLWGCRGSLEALKNVIIHNPGVERNLIGKFKMLFYFLRVEDDSEVQRFGLECIQSVSVSKDCVTNIAESSVMQNVLMLCHTLPSHHELLIETIQHLATNAKIVAEGIVKGGAIYVLDLFVNSKNPNVRIGAASIFSKMCADKLHGPRVVIILSKFLPPIFTDAMRENAEASVHMYEGNHENPELVWDDDARSKVQSVVKEMKEQFYQEQSNNPNAKWDISNDFEVVYTSVAGEVVIGGVYLRLFVKQPNWGLRNPRQFLVALFDKYIVLASGSPNENPISLVAEAIVLLITVQVQLASYAASVGLVAKLFTLMNTQNQHVLKTACQIIHALSNDAAAVEAMGMTKSIEPIMQAIRVHQRTLEVMGEGLKKMYEKNNPERGTLVKQALDCKLIPFLLNLLDDVLNDVEHVSSVKAQIVGALKAMAADPLLGAQVSSQLDESTIWNTYRDQRHDLFITNQSVKGYLTGPVTAAKGYLTAAPTTPNNLSNAPPPDED